MIHAMSRKLTNIFYRNSWIRKDQIAWCIYGVEKAISWCFFCAMIMIYICISKKVVETFLFISVFYLFRQHLGGYHTKHHWSCQILSVGLVVAICSLIGPIIENLDSCFLYFVNIYDLIILFFLEPSFPKQMHLTEKEKRFHKYRIKELVFICAGAQYLIVWFNKTYFVYTLLSLIVVIISVLNGERSF